MTTRVVPMNLREYARYYVALVDGSDGYLRQIEWALHDFEKVVGPIALADLTVELINRYLRERKEQLAPRTRKNRRGYLRTLLHHAASNTAIADRPTLPDAPLARVKVPDTIVEAWTPSQVGQLLTVIDGLDGSYRNGFSKRLYWRSYILAAWDLGLRGCDMRSIERSWIPPDGRFSIVQAKTGRIVWLQLRPPAMEAINDFQHAGRLIWPLWCRQNTWGKIAQALVRRAGLPGSIGWLRASAATATEVTQPGTGHLFLGHTNRRTFEQHYFDRRQEVSRPQPPLLG